MTSPTPTTQAPASTPSDQPLVPANATTLDVVGVRDGMFGAQDGGDTSGFGGLVAGDRGRASSCPPVRGLVR